MAALYISIKRSFFFIPCLLSFVLSANISFAQPVLSLSPVITGLSSPMQLVHANDNSNRIFIVQKAGTILVYNKAYSFLDTFLTVTDLRSENERGLLSLAFDPGYTTNGFFYVYYTNMVGSLEIARYHVSNDPDVADAATKVIVKTILHPNNSNHNGGELHFGVDGYLYLSTGDGGGGGDQPNNAQTTTILLGKILRFNVTNTIDPPYYTIPEGNPFGNEVYAYGLRNPFRWSFDRLTNDIWIGDVGQDSREEINYRRADSIRQSNFGWRCYEGNNTYNTTVGCSGPISNYTFPVYDYPTQDPAAAITGGTVYRGAAYPDLKGYYIGADFYSGKFYKIIYDTVNKAWNITSQTLSPTGMSDFGETENGELYAVSLTSNAVYRVMASGPVLYTFTGDGNWNVATNWSNNVIPPPTLPSGSEISITPAGNGECVLNIQQTISSGAKLTVEPGKNFRIIGDLIIQ